MRDRWNRIVKGLIAVEEEWEALREEVRANRSNLEGLPLDIQKRLQAGYVRAKFDVGLPRLLDHARTRHGLKAMLVEEPIEEGKKVANG